MTSRQIETSREIRLWIAQVIIPLAVIVVMSDDEKRKVVTDKVDKLKRNATSFINGIF